jgi:hypothetical protein
MNNIKYLILPIFCLLMFGCKNNQTTNSILFSASNTISQDSNYKVIDIGTINKNINNVTSIELSPKHNFGFTIELNTKPNTYYLVQLKALSNMYSVNLVAESNWSGWIGTRNPTFINATDDWYYINLLIKTPDTISNNKLKIYAYNWASDTCFVDSLHITESSVFPFIDSLPSFIFNPLTHSILNELAFYTKNTSVNNYEELLDEPLLDIVFDKHFITKKQYRKELNRRIKKTNLTTILNQIKEDASVFKGACVNNKPRETFENKLSGFTEKIIYNQGEKIIIKLQNAVLLKSIQLLLPQDNYTFKKIQDISFTNKDGFEIDTKNLIPNTYCIQLKDGKTIFNIPIIINSNKKSKLILLAPIATWHAYNHYNGKCFYVNTKDDSCVYNISTQRPLISCLFDSILVGHDLFIFSHIYKFFFDNYDCNVYPDYYLEAYPSLFTYANTIVFAQHCEYFSTKMFEALSSFSNTKNIISLGGNQAYYKIQFSNNYKNIECRKDGTFLENTLIPAGTWRTQYSNEAKYWGNAYSDAGYKSYCTYKIQNANHWLFNNCSVKNGDEFGKYGIDFRGLSGDEMDKINDNTPKNALLLAKGTNPNDGGGDIVIIENKNNAILSFGSIACGSGLNKDVVFTQMIQNFIQKYK